MRLKHKNKLFKIIQDSGLGVEHFDINEGETDKVPFLIISYKDSPFQFIIRNSDDNFDLFDCKYTKYGPNYPLSQFEPETGYSDFEFLSGEFLWWLTNVLSPYIEDLNEPDLWEEFKKGNKSFDFNKINFDDKSSFSLDERAQVKLALNELKLLAQKALSTNEKEQEIINARLDYLIDASNRLNKFDWKSLAVSSIISISVALSLDTQKGHLLFELFKKVFSNIPLLMH